MTTPPSSTWSRLGHQLTSAVRRSPVSLGYVVLLWVVALATGSLPSGPTADAASYLTLPLGDLTSRPLGTLTAMAGASDVWALTWGSLAVLVVGLLCEPRLRSARWALLLVLGQVLSLWLALGLAGAAAAVLPDWSTTLLSASVGGPVTALVAAGVASTRSVAEVWRRRVRLLGIGTVTTMALFDGSGLSVRLLVAAGVGLLLGRLLVADTGRRSPVSTVDEQRSLVAAVVATLAVGPIVSSMFDLSAGGPFAGLGIFVVPPGGYGADIGSSVCPPDTEARLCVLGSLFLTPGPGAVIMSWLPSMLLLAVASGLRRGRRLAWGLSILLLLVMAGTIAYTLLIQPLQPSPDDPAAAVSVTDLLGYSVLPVGGPLLIAAFLAMVGRLFTARSAPGSLVRLCGVIVLIAVGGAALYVLAGLALAGQWEPTATLGGLIHDGFIRLAPTDMLFGALVTHAPATAATQAVYYGVGILVWVLGTGAVVRAMGARPAVDPASSRARELLRAHGGPSLAWMGLWEGNTHWFSSSGQAYVPYRVVGNVLLTTGDPVGPADEAGATLREFLAFADSAGLTVAFYSASQALAERTGAMGWEFVRIAEETVLPLPGMAFTGKRFQDVRTALNQATKQGVTTTWTTWPEAPLDVRLQVRALSEQWVGEKALPEMGFTLGGLDELDDPDVRLLLVRDAEGRLDGVASWLPICGPGTVQGWTLDFMRRRPDGFRHTMELIVGQAVKDLQDEGFEILSLSGAPLADAQAGSSEATDGHGTVEQRVALKRLLDILGAQLEPLYGFRSLLRFKAKFQPVYRPLYLVYPDAAALPGIGRAVTQAYVPEMSLGVVWRVASTMRAARDRRDGRSAGASPTPRSER